MPPRPPWIRAWCPSDFSYFDLSVMSRDLSMTLTVFFIWCYFSFGEWFIEIRERREGNVLRVVY